MSSNFIDLVKIYCRSGNGGAGSAHLMRAKYIPRGGPDGGDGGHGGSIIVKGNKQLWTLLHLKYQKHKIATNGESGSKAQRSGAYGQDIIIEVPLGTVIKDADTNEFVFEVTEDEQKHVILEGGRGGLGNQHFKTATNQTPRYAQPGEEGKERFFYFELKILADVGLVGFPNAGKSTLLSVVTAAKPLIADYPFTTLTPNLGIVSYHNYKSFVMADIPGIIEGAHEGKGLGLRFLRHIERNSILLFMVPCNTKNIKKEYNTLLNELKLYNKELLDKKHILAITKTDLLNEKELNKINNKLPEIPTVFISSVAQKGLEELKDLLWHTLNS